MIGKLKAFSAHLLASALVVGVLMAVFVRLWFPMPYFSADGGWQGIRLVMAVDLVLGPVLSLVVYNSRKSRRQLVFDYTVIGILQASALSFGIWTAFTHRTALVVFADGSFYSVDTDLVQRMGDRALSIASRAGEHPAYAVIRMPQEEGARKKLRLESLSRRQPLFTRQDLLEPLSAETASLLREAPLDIEKAIRGRPEREREVRRFLERHAKDASSLSFLPLICKYRNLVLAVDGSGGIVGALSVDLSPSEALNRKAFSG